MRSNMDGFDRDEQQYQFEDKYSKERLSRKALALFEKTKLQPKGNAYNGIGVAKKSVWVALEDDAFKELFEEVVFLVSVPRSRGQLIRRS